MNLLTLLGMVSGGYGDRPGIGNLDNAITYEELQQAAYRGARFAAEEKASTIVFLAENGPAFPVALFAAASAGIPFLPLNYRLAASQLDAIINKQEAPLVITDADASGFADQAVRVYTVQEWLADTRTGEIFDEPVAEPDTDDIAVLLMTSGTTAAPKSAVLRHRHLASYILESVEFAGAEEGEAMIVSVPPYHIAAVANMLSNLYAGRRIVYLENFAPAKWLDVVNREHITNAMVVPTMLARIVELIESGEAAAPTSLRSISYGGAKMARPVLERALTLLPDANFVNAYGLTETSSTVAVLGPDDHRAALASDDEAVRSRLASVGKPLPGITVQIRLEDGTEAGPGEAGDIYLKGAQISGEYLEQGSLLDGDGWFWTRDGGYLDSEGYLFITGRTDDTIIRGGENIAPAEIEAVVHEHPDVADVAVAGVADDEWGQRIAAFVVRKPGTNLDSEEVRQWARAHLRSSKTPDVVLFLDELPHTPTGKVLRRDLVKMVESAPKA